LACLGDAGVAGLSFVGSTSPQGHVGATVAGTRRMADRAAAAGLERVVVDTSGLIGGELGRILKRRKIALLDPDLVICLEHAGECEPILRSYAGRSRPEILRLPVAAHVRRRSAEARRRHREAALNAYFQGAAPLRLALSGLEFRLMGDRSDRAPLDGRDELEGALVGLDDAGGDTLGLGAIRAVDFAGRTLLIDTPVRDVHVAGLRLGARRSEARVM